jgi:hypothetical protein
MRSWKTATCVTLLVGALLVGALPCAADEGVNPADDTSNATIESLFLGEYWFGAQIEEEDLKGKVVVFQIWGS